MDAVIRVIDPATATNVDLKDVRIVKKVGGTIDDTELVDGLVLAQNVIKSAGGPTRVEKAKIGLIQFQLSPPKPDASIIGIMNSFVCKVTCLTLMFHVPFNRWKIKLL